MGTRKITGGKVWKYYVSLKAFKFQEILEFDFYQGIQKDSEEAVANKSS